MSNSLTFRPQQLSAFGPDSQAAQFSVRLAVTPEDRQAIFALRGRAYQAIGYDVDAGADDGYCDRFDDLSTTALVGAYDGDKLVGSVRFCFSHPWQDLSSLPCAAYYPALKDVKRDAVGSLFEVSRLSIDPEITNTSYRTTLYATLVRAGFIAAQAATVSRILIATRPDWVRFYTYMLGFEQIGEPALYPPGDFKITLLGGSLAQANMRQRMQNKFFKITLDEIASMRNALAGVLKRPSAGDRRKVAVAPSA